MTLEEYHKRGIMAARKKDEIYFFPNSGGMTVLEMTFEGYKNLALWAADGGELPDTWTMRGNKCIYWFFRGTGSGFTKPGFHFMDSEKVPLPPSGGFQWETGKAPGEVTLCRLPGELVQEVLEPLPALPETRERAYYDTDSKSFKASDKKEPEPPPRLVPRTAAELDEKDIPPIQWIVVNALPTGLSVIAAPPKSYKSYLALDMSVKVARGEEFLGHPTVKAGCLYMDLESSDRRPRDRLRQILGDSKKPDNLYFLTSEDGIRRIGDGFEDQLNALLDIYQDIKLIVVDVFQLIKPQKKRGLDSYEADYMALGALNTIAKKRDVCIMLIHHTRKGRDTSDAFNNMSGSTAMSGAMDTIFLINRESRTDNNAVLMMSGRDIEPQELALSWNREKFQWDYLGTQEEVESKKFGLGYYNSSTIQTVKKLLSTNGGHWEGTAAEIVAASKYFGTHIFDDPRKVSKDIERYSVLLDFEGITFERVRKDKKGSRSFVFDMSDTSETSDMSDTSETSEE